MENKVILITGSTDGIGKQIAIDLAELGATVLIHGRNRARCENTLTEIKKKTGNRNLDFFVADLASLGWIRNLAEEIKSKHDQLDVLINNAGVIENRRKLTEDGYEMTFAVNHLSYFLFRYFQIAEGFLKYVQCRFLTNPGTVPFEYLEAWLPHILNVL